MGDFFQSLSKKEIKIQKPTGKKAEDSGTDGNINIYKSAARSIIKILLSDSQIIDKISKAKFDESELGSRLKKMSRNSMSAEDFYSQFMETEADEAYQKLAAELRGILPSTFVSISEKQVEGNPSIKSFSNPSQDIAVYRFLDMKNFKNPQNLWRFITSSVDTKKLRGLTVKKGNLSFSLIRDKNAWLLYKIYDVSEYPTWEKAIMGCSELEMLPEILIYVESQEAVDEFKITKDINDKIKHLKRLAGQHEFVIPSTIKSNVIDKIKPLLKIKASNEARVPYVQAKPINLYLQKGSIDDLPDLEESRKKKTADSSLAETKPQAESLLSFLTSNKPPPPIVPSNPSKNLPSLFSSSTSSKNPPSILPPTPQNPQSSIFPSANLNPPQMFPSAGLNTPSIFPSTSPNPPPTNPSPFIKASQPKFNPPIALPMESQTAQISENSDSMFNSSSLSRQNAPKQPAPSILANPTNPPKDSSQIFNPPTVHSKPGINSDLNAQKSSSEQPMPQSYPRFSLAPEQASKSSPSLSSDSGKAVQTPINQPAPQTKTELRPPPLPQTLLSMKQSQISSVPTNPADILFIKPTPNDHVTIPIKGEKIAAKINSKSVISESDSDSGSDSDSDSSGSEVECEIGNISSASPAIKTIPIKVDPLNSNPIEAQSRPVSQIVNMKVPNPPKQLPTIPKMPEVSAPPPSQSPGLQSNLFRSEENRKSLPLPSPPPMLPKVPLPRVPITLPPAPAGKPETSKTILKSNHDPNKFWVCESCTLINTTDRYSCDGCKRVNDYQRTRLLNK
ncbi:unnamed protein product [Blepharisma stoltei]|uniref:RanBP2-type domain-containing protein n=1 Tax=Blepharisma stoltei TaxID=1481888 RepID=A0AAU9IKQ6_9CILI|nr:unnamed protein product [Blepharisma stoltei]